MFFNADRLFILRYFYRVHHTNWSDDLDCPVQHYEVLSVLLNKDDFGHVVISCHIDSTTGMQRPQRHKFFNSRSRCYQNADATFQYQRLLRCGDINPNPQSFHVLAVRGHARAISEPYNATAATCGAMLNVLKFLRTNTSGYQVLTIPGTAMPVLLNGFQTRSSLNQPGTCLIIRPLQFLTSPNLKSLM